MSKEQKTYTKEFKIEAVRLAETSGKPITEIAREGQSCTGSRKAKAAART
jgi:transposase-like protein